MEQPSRDPDGHGASRRIGLFARGAGGRLTCPRVHSVRKRYGYTVMCPSLRGGRIPSTGLRVVAHATPPRQARSNHPDHGRGHQSVPNCPPGVRDRRNRCSVCLRHSSVAPRPLVLRPRHRRLGLEAARSNGQRRGHIHTLERTDDPLRPRSSWKTPTRGGASIPVRARFCFSEVAVTRPVAPRRQCPRGRNRDISSRPREPGKALDVP